VRSCIERGRRLVSVPDVDAAKKWFDAETTTYLQKL
jgi:hypothetical protein